MKFNLDNLVLEYEKLQEALSNPEIFKDPKKVKEFSLRKKQIQESVELYKKYKDAYKALNEAIEVIRDEKDEEMRKLAKIQKDESETKIAELEEKIKYSLLPKDNNDDKNIILEVRAGTGGEEASLFASELAKSYMIFAQDEGFGVEVIQKTPSDSGGVKEIIIEIKGEGAYKKFKYESGVHRVQRVPETESKGRVHTSAVTVAVLPEADEIDVEIKEEDLEIKACRASGAGGQHVNKTDSAVHVTHIPTGISVFCQESRSQHKNKERALQILRSKIYAMEQERIARERGEQRLAQIGTGDRSEKIRTYNFPQDRVTDHRIGQNFSGISDIMMGKLGPIVDALTIFDEQTKLQASSEIS